MSVSSTNSLYNTPKQRKHAFESAVKDKMIKHNNRFKAYKRMLKKNNKFKLCICTQCKRYMDGYLGNKQKENKRENAPICIPCILGIKRKPLELKNKN